LKWRPVTQLIFTQLFTLIKHWLKEVKLGVLTVFCSGNAMIIKGPKGPFGSIAVMDCGGESWKSILASDMYACSACDASLSKRCSSGLMGFV
jgi:hypothetical protein